CAHVGGIRRWFENHGRNGRHRQRHGSCPGQGWHAWPRRNARPAQQDTDPRKGRRRAVEGRRGGLFHRQGRCSRCVCRGRHVASTHFRTHGRLENGQGSIFHIPSSLSPDVP